MRYINSVYNFRNRNGTSSFLCLPVFFSLKTSFTTNKFLPYHFNFFWTQIECSWPLLSTTVWGIFSLKILNEMARICAMLFTHNHKLLKKIDIESNMTSQWIYHQEDTPKSLTRCWALLMTSRYKYLPVDILFIQHT